MKILPKKIYFDEALAYLELTELGKNRGYQILLQLNQGDGVPLYFDTIMDFCRKATDSHKILTDGLVEGRGKRAMFSESGTVQTNDDAPKRLLTAEPEDSDDRFWISVIKFIAEGHEYFVVDKMVGRYASGTKVSPAEFYFARENFAELIGANPASPAINVAPPVMKKKQDRDINKARLEVFKGWLGGAGKAYSNGEPDYQQCYKNLDQPTSTEMWDKLRQIDRKLFAAEPDKFFSKHQDLITLRKGTSKGR